MILSKEPMRISNVEGEEHISFPGEGLIGMMWLNLGVSDHQKASLDPIIFWKHQYSLMCHIIFKKRIGSIIFILNHSGNLVWGHFNIFGVFSCRKTFFFLSRKTFLQCIYLNAFLSKKNLYWQVQQNCVKKSWNDRKYVFNEP